jgi:hypothetical protein
MFPPRTGEKRGEFKKKRMQHYNEWKRLQEFRRRYPRCSFTRWGKLYFVPDLVLAVATATTPAKGRTTRRKKRTTTKIGMTTTPGPPKR